VTTGPAQTVAGLVAHRAAVSPGARMVADENSRQLPFEQIALESERVAAGLLACGVQPGDVVSWQLPNGIETITLTLTLALARLGVVSNRKLPEQLELVGALPRHAMGKVVKRELVARFLVKETVK
jgi:non-ribosomal peptide synthetase component E (peptide arylation enzyme)